MVDQRTFAQPHPHIRMLVVPSSIGCEPYTFAMMAENAGVHEQKTFQIDTFDISDEFTRVAKAGVYPVQALKGLPDELMAHFTISTDGKFAAVNDDIKAKVNILPHSSLQRFKCDDLYDVVVCQNFLKHIYNYMKFTWDKNPERHARQSKQAQAIQQLCDLTRDILFVDMIEETPFCFHYPNVSFNPFEEAGMVYLGADLQPFAEGVRYPKTKDEVYGSIKDRELVHALQRK